MSIVETLGIEDFYSGSSEISKIFDNVRLSIPSYDPHSEEYINSLSFNDDIFLAVLTYYIRNPGEDNRLTSDLADKVWRNFNDIGRVTTLADFTADEMSEPLIYEGIFEVKWCKGFDLKDINERLLVGYIQFPDRVFAPVMTYPYKFVSKSQQVDSDFIGSIRDAIIALSKF